MGSTRRHPSRGFTLIELLVVIAIIGVLSSIVLASLNTARARARDAQRISDLRQIQTALELYYSDRGYYPPSTCGHDCNGYSQSHAATWTTLATELAPYIKLPRDPLNTGNCPPWVTGCYTYSYGNVTRTIRPVQYDLTAQLETQHPLRCAIRQYRFHWINEAWCGAYSGQIYEASP